MADIAGAIAALVAQCKGEVTITFNEHRNNYQTVAQLVNAPYYDDQFADVAPDVLAEMKALNAMVSVQCYPDSPVGFVVVMHHDLVTALDEMTVLIREDAENQALDHA